MRLIIALMLISFTSFAANWNEIEISKEYKLTQSFQLQQNGRAGSILDVMEGEKVELTEIMSLDMISVTLFQFSYKNCPGPEMVTEMEIIPVKNTSPVVEVGAVLEQNCSLEFYIENKDLMTQSFFE